MTAFKRIFLRCNGCGEFLESNTIPSAETVVAARRMAHLAGWVHDKLGRDMCGNCRTFKAPVRRKLHGPRHWGRA